MSKITISSIGSLNSLTKINDAVQSVTGELNNKVLYRDNPDGEANQMENELDMNSNDIANAKDIYTSRLYLNGVEVTALYSAPVAPVETDTSWFYEDDDANVSLGSTALDSLTSGDTNTATGYNALLSIEYGYGNTAFGSRALESSSGGYLNTATGSRALYSTASGSENTATGASALYRNTYGSYNTATGTGAMYYNISGISNTATGYQALRSNTTGRYNVATGEKALWSNTTADYNTAYGVFSMYSNTEGDNNTATGRYALYYNTTGENNSANGYRALFSNTSYNNVSGLGHNSAVTGSDQVQLGDSDTTTYVYGTVQDRSDLRDKADVRDTILGLDFITALRPVDYRWDLRDDYKPDAPTEPEPLKDDATEQDIQAHELALSQYENDFAEWLIAVKHENLIHDGTHKRSRYHHGVIAQEVAEVIAESGIDFGGYQDHKVSGGEDVLSIGYDELIGPLIKALQEVNQKFDALKEEFDDYVETHS